MSRARPDDDLPPLPPGINHLRGPALVRAAYHHHRKPPDATQRRWKRPTAPTHRDTPAKPPQPRTAPITPTPPEAWTPTTILDTIPTGPEPPHDDWRDDH